jgi:hypothetical protein
VSYRVKLGLASACASTEVLPIAAQVRYPSSAVEPGGWSMAQDEFVRSCAEAEWGQRVALGGEKWVVCVCVCWKMRLTGAGELRGRVGTTRLSEVFRPCRPWAGNAAVAAEHGAAQEVQTAVVHDPVAPVSLAGR